MNRRRLLALAAGSLAVLAAAASARGYHRDLARAQARLQGRSSLVRTRSGAMEYAEAGQGPPILMIHGTGGGFDQGLAFAHGLAEAGWRVIAPSRFGYLRSDFPNDASSEAQADAFLDLLDALGLERVPVVGGSAGALSAMAFAIRHPRRCLALAALVPAAFAPGRPAPRPPNAVAAAIIEHGLRSDLLFWLGMTLAEDAMIASLLATDPALVHAAEPAEQARIRGILSDILPVSARTLGLLNDARLAGNPEPMPLERIAAPTLALSLEDDRFETLAAARHLAASVPDARLVSWPRGGHVWVGHDGAVTAELDAFLRAAA